jgi:hypothetical protein
MRAPLIAAMVAAAGFTVLAQPAMACSNGYEPVWIQGHKLCKIKTPKLPIKAKQGYEPGKAPRALKSR